MTKEEKTRLNTELEKILILLLAQGIISDYKILAIK